MKRNISDNSYELIFIAKNDKEEVLNRISKLIEADAGKIEKKEAWGKKNFFYPIKKESNGYYFEWKINMNKANIKGFKKNLDYDEEVLRYLMLSK